MHLWIKKQMLISRNNCLYSWTVNLLFLNEEVLSNFPLSYAYIVNGNYSYKYDSILSRSDCKKRPSKFFKAEKLDIVAW